MSQHYPIRTLVVDDSATVKNFITSILAAEPEVDVVGTASDIVEAREKIISIEPDLVLLDLDMPKLDGLAFLKLVMRYKPTPVVILGGAVYPGSVRTLECLEAGAKAIMLKPRGPFSPSDIKHLIGLIRTSAERRSQSAPLYREARSIDQPTLPSKPVLPATAGSPHPRSIILLGASTGGTEALRELLVRLPDGLPPICMVQHIPAKFSAAFAGRLNQDCHFDVHEARDLERLRPGMAVVAPGGYHLTVKWNGVGYTTLLGREPSVHFQRPAVDILFESAVSAGAGPHSIAALLTGMGSDGARGLLALRQAGARTIAQSEDTCVVFGMPREAIKLGAAQHVVDLGEIPEVLLRELGSAQGLPEPA